MRICKVFTIKLFWVFFVFHLTKACVNINVSITQTIDNPGFHKIISWLLDFSIEPPLRLQDLQTNFVLYLKIPSGIYVNPDEIADVTRRGELDIKIVGNVDVEAPMHLSDEHQVFIYIPKKDTNLVSVTLPIHLRYQTASLEEQFGKVILNKPSLLFYTIPETEEIICGKHEELTFVCQNSKENCTWNNISYQALFDESVLLVPVGNLQHYPFVMITTILLGCIGCLHILSLLMASKAKQE